MVPSSGVVRFLGVAGLPGVAGSSDVAGSSGGAGFPRACLRGFAPVAAAVLSTAATAPPALCGQTPSLAFESTAAEFDGATAEYRAMWADEGARIVSTLERVSGLRFAIDSIHVEVMEAASWAGTDRMGMRASYHADTKRATLAHELGHILIGDLIPDDAEPGTVPESHYLLFLFLYDAWVELWGVGFADEQVVVESARRGGVDYEGIWKAVLEHTAEERAGELADFIRRFGGSRS